MRPLKFSSWIAGALLTLASCGAARAGFITDTLGSAGPSNFSLLALTTANQVQIAGANAQPPVPGGGVGGNVGVATNHTFSLSGPAQVTGNVYLSGNAGQFNNSSNAANGGVGGSVFTGGVGPNGTTLNQANSDALNAAHTFATLSPTQSVTGGAVNGTTTISAANPGGLNVVNLSGINLGNGQSLTLSGPAGTQFILNNSGNLTLNSGAINLAGGLTPSDVAINMTNGGTVSTSGGLNNESVINGVVLDPTGNLQLTPGLVNGEIIGGGSISLASGATVNGSPPSPSPVPAPPGVVLLGLGGFFFGLIVVRSPRRKVVAAAN
jgi:hypothetical protein